MKMAFMKWFKNNIRDSVAGVMDLGLCTAKHVIAWLVRLYGKVKL